MTKLSKKRHFIAMFSILAIGAAFSFGIGQAKAGDDVTEDQIVRALTPAKPLALFLYMYIVRLGLLDGRAGLRFCLLHAWYQVADTSAAALSFGGIRALEPVVVHRDRITTQPQARSGNAAR